MDKFFPNFDPTAETPALKALSQLAMRCQMDSMISQQGMDVKLVNDPAAVLKVRVPRGSLVDSMATQYEIPATKEALIEFLEQQYPYHADDLKRMELQFDPICYDARIQQNVIYVSLKHIPGVLGIIDNIPGTLLPFNEVRHAKTSIQG